MDVWTEPVPDRDPEEENERLRIALTDAIKGMERMLPYINDYRREEHRLDVYLHRARESLYDGLPPTWENTQRLQEAQDQIDRMQRRLSD